MCIDKKAAVIITTHNHGCINSGSHRLYRAPLPLAVRPHRSEHGPAVPTALNTDQQSNHSQHGSAVPIALNMTQRPTPLSTRISGPHRSQHGSAVHTDLLNMIQRSPPLQTPSGICSTTQRSPPL
jgi:hypothetical protein